MMIIHLILLSVWAADPNMADPALSNRNVEGGVPCLENCGRPTPSTKLSDFTNAKDAPKKDSGEATN